MTFSENIDIVVLGAGNVATQIASALYKSGFTIKQIYSKTFENASLLSSKVNAKPTDNLSAIYPDARLYIIAVADDAIADVCKSLKHVRGLVVHTSGSTDMNVLQDIEHNGVFYPLQTFSKDRTADFKDMPFLIEARHENDVLFLKEIAEILSAKVFFIDSEQRRHVHLAAVFTCNFTNHMYALAHKILAQKNIDFELLRPLIMETANKVGSMLPNEAQTGPALRRDKNVMNKHIEMLSEFEYMKKIYQIISSNIAKENI